MRDCKRCKGGEIVLPGRDVRHKSDCSYISKKSATTKATKQTVAIGACKSCAKMSDKKLIKAVQGRTVLHTNLCAGLRRMKNVTWELEQATITPEKTPNETRKPTDRVGKNAKRLPGQPAVSSLEIKKATEAFMKSGKVVEKLPAGMAHGAERASQNPRSDNGMKRIPKAEITAQRSKGSRRNQKKHHDGSPDRIGH